MMMRRRVRTMRTRTTRTRTRTRTRRTRTRMMTTRAMTHGTVSRISCGSSWRPLVTGWGVPNSASWGTLGAFLGALGA
eukprot:9481999-Pyramimonas_sp.AAC.1